MTRAWLHACVQATVVCLTILVLDWLTGSTSRPWTPAFGIAMVALARTHYRPTDTQVAA